MAINVVKYGDEVLIDISDSTVTEDNLQNGAVAYKADGTRIVGKYIPDSGVSGATAKKIVVFGDSLADGADASTGSGNAKQYSFVTYFDTDVFDVLGNHAVSGSCFGNYAAASVGNNKSVTDMVNAHTSDVVNADIVLISCGGNDTNAVIAGRTNWKNVINKASEAIGTIRSINNACRIILLCSAFGVASSDTVTSLYTDRHWTFKYAQDFFMWLCDQYNIECITPFKSTGINFTTSDLMQSDWMHPTVEGAKLIAKSVTAQIISYDTLQRTGVVHARLTPGNPSKLRADILGEMMGTGCSILGIADDGKTSIYHIIASGCDYTGGISWFGAIEVSGSIIGLSYKLTANNVMSYNTYAISATKL